MFIKSKLIFFIFLVLHFPLVVHAQGSKSWHEPKCNSFSRDLSTSIEMYARNKTMTLPEAQNWITSVACGSTCKTDVSLRIFLKDAVALVYRDPPAGVRYAQSPKFMQDCLKASKD